MKSRNIAIFLSTLCMAGAAQAMTVQEFLAKAAGLQARGPLAMLSSDYTLMQTEMRSSFASLREERLAARAAGRRQAYCPAGPATLDMQEQLVAMTAVPVALRSRTQVREALRAALARKYPCPA